MVLMAFFLAPLVKPLTAYQTTKVGTTIKPVNNDTLYGVFLLVVNQPTRTQRGEPAHAKRKYVPKNFPKKPSASADISKKKKVERKNIPGNIKPFLHGFLS